MLMYFLAVYESSCEAYKHRGNISGLYHVDLDGSGPIRAQFVYCNMTGNTYTLIHTHTKPIGPQLILHDSYADNLYNLLKHET